MNKKTIRKNISKERDLLSQDEINKKSQAIRETFLKTNLYKEAQSIFSFISFGSEVDTHPLAKQILQDGKKLGVPYTIPKSRDMIVAGIQDFQRDLESGYYGILAPRKNELDLLEAKNIDLVIVPGLAFDNKGYRVGYGGGYYDTFLAKIRKDTIKVGISFDLQLIEKCPINQFDIPVDFIVTESGIKEIL